MDDLPRYLEFGRRSDQVARCRTTGNPPARRGYADLCCSSDRRNSYSRSRRHALTIDLLNNALRSRSGCATRSAARRRPKSRWQTGPHGTTAVSAEGALVLITIDSGRRHRQLGSCLPVRVSDSRMAGPGRVRQAAKGEVRSNKSTPVSAFAVYSNLMPMDRVLSNLSPISQYSQPRCDCRSCHWWLCVQYGCAADG